MNVLTLTPDRLRRAKSAYTVRHVRPESRVGLRIDDIHPCAGDVVLAEVQEIGQHKRIELADGRKSVLFPGDEVIVAYGHRYAPNQFEAIVPQDLGACDLVAAGGVAGKVLCRHAAVGEPTRIRPKGLVTDGEGHPLNMRRWRIPELTVSANRPPTMAVTGTSMDCGKTTAAVGLIRGLVRAGLTVGAAKVTGTGAGGDIWRMADAGAAPALDFTHAGFASTYRCTTQELTTIFKTLTGHLAIAAIVFIFI